jgi:hypothetical protein
VFLLGEACGEVVGREKQMIELRLCTHFIPHLSQLAVRPGCIVYLLTEDTRVCRNEKDYIAFWWVREMRIERISDGSRTTIKKTHEKGKENEALETWNDKTHAHTFVHATSPSSRVLSFVRESASLGMCVSQLFWHCNGCCSLVVRLRERVL